MNAWARDTFGDPCRGCGFSWSMPVDVARAVVDEAPRWYAELVAAPVTVMRHPDLDWSPVGYVSHVGDSIRIWAERVATVTLGNDEPVALYDQDLLATARHYDDIDVGAALWSLERAVGDWQTALAAVRSEAFVMRHEEVGDMTLDDVIRIRAHDVVHHAWDIERTLASTG